MSENLSVIKPSRKPHHECYEKLESGTNSWSSNPGKGTNPEALFLFVTAMIHRNIYLENTKKLGDLEIIGRIRTIQTTAHLKSIKILRKVREI